MFCCPRCSHLSTILNNIVEPESGVTILFNIVGNCEQCGQQSIVQSCFHQYCINLSVFTRVVRRVSVRKAAGTYQRDIRKLCMLEEQVVNLLREQSNS